MGRKKNPGRSRGGAHRGIWQGAVRIEWPDSNRESVVRNVVTHQRHIDYIKHWRWSSGIM